MVCEQDKKRRKKQRGASEDDEEREHAIAREEGGKQKAATSASCLEVDLQFLLQLSIFDHVLELLVIQLAILVLVALHNAKTDRQTHGGSALAGRFVRACLAAVNAAALHCCDSHTSRRTRISPPLPIAPLCPLPDLNDGSIHQLLQLHVIEIGSNHGLQNVIQIGVGDETVVVDVVHTERDCARETGQKTSMSESRNNSTASSSAVRNVRVESACIRNESHPLFSPCVLRCAYVLLTFVFLLLALCFMRGKHGERRDELAEINFAALVDIEGVDYTIHERIML